ncbi:MAG: 2Fe-2S iron-sulfur cluster binding domain-containing protein [Betaproteobacteria bacterium]|nr:2Fe-2S iron-sulfur cluster binding domain-containing protein [Betaproteobacteria bacterium]
MSERYVIHVEDIDEVFRCGAAQDLLRAMEALGRRGIPVGCRGGACGVCKVLVTQGRYRTRKMSRACIAAEEETEGVVLACKLFPLSDLRIRVIGKISKALKLPSKA